MRAKEANFVPTFFLVVLCHSGSPTPRLGPLPAPMSFVVTIRIVGTVIPGFAVLFTLLRLYYRWSRRHLGLDDAWAAFAVLCVFFMTAGAWVRTDRPGVGPFNHSQHVRVIGYYMLNVSFTCVLWAARMSILFSIVRLIPYVMVLRRYAYACALLFGVMWIVLIIHKVVVCEMDTTWKRLPGVQCVLGESVGVVELATDCIADFILVILPVRLLWSVKLAIPRRKLLMAIFSASIITTVVSVVHTVYVFSPNRNAEGILAHVEASTSLIICNLAVLVTWMARVIFRGYDMDSPQGGSPDPSSVRGASRPNELSTLRFEHPAPIVLHSLDEPRPTDNKALTLSNTSIEHDAKAIF